MPTAPSYLHDPLEVVTMFHGTDGKHAASIIENGLQPSRGGRLGPAVCLTPVKDVASTIVKHRGLQFVVECEVTVGKVFAFGDGTLEGSGQPKYSKAWSDSSFNSAKAMHGPCAEVATPFCEFCVHDAKAVQVVKVEGFVAAPA